MMLKQGSKHILKPYKIFSTLRSLGLRSTLFSFSSSKTNLLCKHIGTKRKNTFLFSNVFSINFFGGSKYFHQNLIINVSRASTEFKKNIAKIFVEKYWLHSKFFVLHLCLFMITGKKCYLQEFASENENRKMKHKQCKIAIWFPGTFGHTRINCLIPQLISRLKSLQEKDFITFW